MPSRVEPNSSCLPSGDHDAISDEKKPFQLGYASTTAVASGARAASRWASASLSTVGSTDVDGGGAGGGGGAGAGAGASVAAGQVGGGAPGGGPDRGADEPAHATIATHIIRCEQRMPAMLPTRGSMRPASAR